MKTIDVASSQFKKAAYNEETEELFIVFNNDSIYKYSDVPEVVFEGIEAAASKGAYFIATVKKGGFAYEKVDEIPNIDSSERTITLTKHEFRATEDKEAVKSMADLRETIEEVNKRTVLVTPEENSDVNIPDDPFA